MKTSKEAIDKIREFEGLHLTPYRKGYEWAIGIGHRGISDKSETITKETAEQLFLIDLALVERYINARGWELTQGQFDALVSFCLDWGTPSFVQSALRKNIIKKSEEKCITKCFMMWVRSRSCTIPELVERREWEVSKWKE